MIEKLHGVKLFKIIECKDIKVKTALKFVQRVICLIIIGWFPKSMNSYFLKIGLIDFIWKYSNKLMQ